MASINKLSIRGIRSFSPEDSEQVLEFFFPVTVLVGANGCGKTTVIEALKYAITGGLPPGARSGQSFVHDARSIGQTNVKACVKLRFLTRAGQPMVVVRSMELTQKKTTSSFKQLDGVLRTQDPRTGERQSLSHKCGELDRQIPQLLGVSKAILDYVLFCHQEDSSWPLQEGAILKKRFDEIFDSSRYTKAVDVMRKKEKAYAMLAKDIKADLAGLNSHKHAAQGFRNELQAVEEAIEETEEAKVDLQRKIQEAEMAMKEQRAIIGQLDEVDGEINLLEDEARNLQVVVEKQRGMLEQDWTQSKTLEELQQLLDDFDLTMESKNRRLQQLQRQQEKLQRDIDTMRQEEKDLTKLSTQLQVSHEAQEKRLKQRYHIMEHLAQSYGLDLGILSQQSSDQSFVASINMVSSPTKARLTQDSDEDMSIVLTPSKEDVESFMAAVDKKHQQLVSDLAVHREQAKKSESKFFSEIGTLKGRLESIQNDLKRIADQRAEYMQEHNELNRRMSTRTRKADVEEARKKADELAKQRDEANSDPRKAQIPTEIRHLEDKIDAIKRQMDDDRITLETLRFSADAQNSISVLKEQCVKEVEALHDSIREQASLLQKYNVQFHSPYSDDDDGEALQREVENLFDLIRHKYDDAHNDLIRAGDEVTRTQQIVSEKTALMVNSQASYVTLKSRVERLSGSVQRVREVVQELRQYEAQLGKSVRVGEETPRELLEYLQKRLEDLDDDSPTDISHQNLKKLIKRLKKMVKVAGSSSDDFQLQCPCCKRGLENADEVQIFQLSMDELMGDSSPLINIDPQQVQTKANLERWKRIVSECLDDVRDYHRMNQEMTQVDKENQKLVDDVAHYQAKLREQKNEKADFEKSDAELREALDVAKRWVEDATRVSEKRIHCSQKQIELSASLVETGRDIKTVERELNQKMEEKDEYSNKINVLNREMTNLNNRISQLSMSASRMDQLAREKEEKYASEQKGNDRKTELSVLIANASQEEAKFQEQVVPLTKKISSKKQEQDRIRANDTEREEKLSKELRGFEDESNELRTLLKDIELYEVSKSEEERYRVESQISELLTRVSQNQEMIEALAPQLEESKNAVSDQERHKKQIQQNIEIVEATGRIDCLEKELEKLRKKRQQIKGSETAYVMYEASAKKREEQQEAKLRAEGRFSELVEQMRSLKRKLKSPEYKDVDEEYRKAVIKYETTLMAAEDMKKYYTAVDKALLMFHGIKIKEINKIIRELWLLTYKGEDITTIEIVSGQEPGSKAQKSYNYRVMMTKGGSDMEMRGRCSAGQRVLASIVIRLALAESFGVNCGCIALDEPTVNLDYKNKKGLAVALAQIVASRAQQRNFQLILITHDEEFVSMMKTELSSLTGFSMPEKYFQVRREQGIDGKFYSKIDAVDWDELV